MSEYIFVGSKITFPALRDYIIGHRLNEGDIVVLNPKDFEEIIHEIKTTGDGIPDIPINVLGVLIKQDHDLNVPVGKVQIINAEKPF
ncbi:MAG TPA: hypothetical protein VF676_00930 [Flavobacterium sp.]|jgi:hypothetical protein